MNFHAKLAIFVTIVGLLGLSVWKIAEPMLAKSRAADVSDVGEKGVIQIGVDGWVGYFPLCSPQMKKRLNREGYGLKCVDDAADYNDRFKKLKSNEYQFAVATVDSYLLNGKQFSYPGPIVAVIDESKGGDAIVARKDKLPTLEELKTTESFTVAFTPDSPSHHLLKAVATHFDVAAFRNNDNFLLADGSGEALNALKNNKADVAVLWEPEVSKALENESFVRLLGTEDTKQLIVDVLLASQRTVKRDPDLIRSFFKSYFKTLKFYRENQQEFIVDIKDHYDIKTSTAESLLTGVQWASLNDNVERWYGVGSQNFSEEALIDTLETAAEILVESRDFSSNPIPEQDPYRLVNSGFVREMNERLSQGGFASSSVQQRNGELIFSVLDESQWQNLQEIGSLKTRKITFSSGTSDLTLDGKGQIDNLIDDLKHYPNFRIEIRGHTGTRGDREANLKLSHERANAVLAYIESVHTLEKNRARAVGFGGQRPLKKQSGESNRAYNYRLPRVEIALVREVL